MTSLPKAFPDASCKSCVEYRRLQGSPQHTLREKAVFDTSLLAQGNCQRHALPHNAGVTITLVVMQVLPVLLDLSISVVRIRDNLHTDSSNEARISAALIQICRSNGTTLLMLGWATLLSDHTATRRSSGYVISVQLDTCTAGKRLSAIAVQVVGVLCVAAVKYASTTL